jgi:hypothetical protein
MATLDSTLNWLVPTIIILIFAAIFYNALKAPIDRVIGWIRDAFGWGKEQIIENIGQSDNYKTVFKYE